MLRGVKCDFILKGKSALALIRQDHSLFPMYRRAKPASSKANSDFDKNTNRSSILGKFCLHNQN